MLAWVSAQADGMLGGTPQSDLIIDESAFNKKGASSAGVARQYNGRIGKVDSCQVWSIRSFGSGSARNLGGGAIVSASGVVREFRTLQYG